jgi:hypothetical protein
MHSLRACFLNDLKNGVHIEVRLAGWWGSNSVGFICLGNEHLVNISIGVDCDCLNAHMLAALNHSSGDLSSVSDEDLVESLGVSHASGVCQTEISSRLVE